jgi:hypothetical protein
MAEDLNCAKIYFWVCIKYVHNCHESGELQGFNEIENYNDNNNSIVLILLLYFSFI